MVGRPDIGVALLERLESNGGTVVARTRHGAFVILSRSPRPGGAAGTAGYIPQQMVGADADDLAANGWLATWRGLERDWSTATYLGKTIALREVDQAIDILAHRRGMRGQDIELRYVSPFGSDAGYAQGGCVLAALGGLVGNMVATVVLISVHPDWISRRGGEPAAAIGGLVVGCAVSLLVAVIVGLFVVGAGLTPVLGLSQRMDRYAVRVYYIGMLAVPSAIAAFTLWFLASVNR